MDAVAVPTRIDVDNAAEVLESLRQATQGGVGAQPALDLAPLQDFDSAALSLLLQLARERSAPAGSASSGSAAASAVSAVGDTSQAAGVPLLLLNPPRKLRALAELYGIEEMLFGAAAGPAGQATSS